MKRFLKKLLYKIMRWRGDEIKGIAMGNVYFSPSLKSWNATLARGEVGSWITSEDFIKLMNALVGANRWFIYAGESIITIHLYPESDLRYEFQTHRQEFIIFKYLNHNFVFELEYQVPTKLRVIKIAHYIQTFILNEKCKFLAERVDNGNKA